MSLYRRLGRSRCGVCGLATAVGLALATLIGAPGASANTLSAGSLTQSPDQPFGTSPGACATQIANSESKGSINYPDAEVEPLVAVDPTNSQHLVAAFQQDRWNDGGANGSVAVVSTHGGSSWSLSGTQAPFTICTGGTLDRSSDPTVAFSSDGNTVYQASLAFNANGPAFGGTSSVQVSRSTDGGVTWQTPAVPRLDTSTTVLNDKEWVTADPANASNAYLVWDRLVSPSVNANPTAYLHTPAFRGPTWFSQTNNSGATWSPGRIIYDPGQNNQTIDNEIVVPKAGRAAGTLFDGFTLILNKGGKGNRRRTAYLVAMIHSADGGSTWSQPTIINPLIDAPVTIAGHLVRTGDILPQFTSDPGTGNMYVVWQDGRFSSTGQAKIAFSQSTDGGKTWSTPIRIDQSGADNIPAFTPQITVNSDGTIGVTYYDMENAAAQQPGLTDEYIVHCHAATDDCTDPASWSTWGETRLSTSGSFDMTTAPDAVGYFTGDYEGLAAGGSVFDPFWVMAQPIATKGKTDPFSNTAQ